MKTAQAAIKHQSRPRGYAKRPYSDRHPRRKFLHLAAGAAALPAVSRIARAQAYPTRPITMIVPSAAGGPQSAFARLVAERMRGSLGQPVIVENVGGADGSVGTGRAKPDGHTVVLGALGSLVLNAAFYSLPYDVLSDFVPIAAMATTHNALFARKAMPATDLNELIAWLKANPNKASMGLTAMGQRLVAAFFQKETGTRFAIVPYRGSAPARQDLLAGHIDLLMDTEEALPLFRGGGARGYAVTSEARLDVAPDIPTFAEMGLPTLSWTAWYGLFAPRGTPRDIIGKLNAAAVTALADPALGTRLVDPGMEIFPRERQTPEALGAMQRTDAEKW